MSTGSLTLTDLQMTHQSHSSGLTEYEVTGRIVPPLGYRVKLGFERHRLGGGLAPDPLPELQARVAATYGVGKRRYVCLHWEGPEARWPLESIPSLEVR